MIDFPLYAVRQHYGIEEEYKYKIIHTQKTKYILDYISRDIPLFKDRRVKLLTENYKGYKLYPLSVRIETVSQLLKTKHRTFIDKYGNIKTWKPKKFFSVVTVLAESYWRSDEGYWYIKPKGYGSVFKVALEPTRYVQVVDLGENRCILYDLTEERLPKKRIKL